MFNATSSNISAISWRLQITGVDFTKSRKSKINRKCYRKCDFQAFDWLKFTLTTDLTLTTFCEIDHRSLNNKKKPCMFPADLFVDSMHFA